MSDDEMEWEKSPQASGGPQAKTKDEFQVTLSIRWSESSPPQKSDRKLEIALQSWANNREFKGNCEVLEVQDNGIANIKIKPAPDLNDLQDLCGKTLQTKENKSVTILRVILIPAGTDAQIAHNAAEPQNGAGQLERDAMTTNTLLLSESQSTEETSNSPSSSYGLKSEDRQPVKQSSSSSPGALSSEGKETNKETAGILPVSQLMYMSNICKKEIDDIVKNNGVIMTAEACVKFSAGEGAGNPDKALCEFTDLVQKVEYSGSNFTPKTSGPEELMESLKIILTKESKLMLTLSAEEMVICGPSHHQDAFKKSLKIKDINLSVKEFMASTQYASPNIDMHINDPLFNTGLIFEEDHWKLMNHSFHQDLRHIEAKFGVDIKSSEASQGTVNIKTCNKGFIKNASMESHAFRALLRLCQKIATSPYNFNQPHGASGFSGLLKNASGVDESEGPSSPFNFNQPHGAAGFSGPLKNVSGVDESEGPSSPFTLNQPHGAAGFSGPLKNVSGVYESEGPSSPFNFNQPHGAAGFNWPLKNVSGVDESEGASGGPELKGKQGYNIHFPEAPKEEGATAGDDKEETCPICLDAFTKKTSLKCKHEFCKGCLEESKEKMGPICPVCKHVFGKLEGDQPPGTMTTAFSRESLPGFPKCGHIVINYNIPNGKQTAKHPEPGKVYYGTTRQAYLPDNKEGKEVLHLLKRAFDQKLIFTIGTSRTTGYKNQVTWNDIHHKTAKTGGTTGYGYPDKHYLSRVKEELKDKGIE